MKLGTIRMAIVIYSSSVSSEAVLLNNGNRLPSIPVAHSTHMVENYQNGMCCFDKINYEAHKWDVVGDLKMICFLLGQQGGFTKYSCFLCLWDSRATDTHYSNKIWLNRYDRIPGMHNIFNRPLIDGTKILLPPLHIKLGLVEQFVKALDSQAETFLHSQLMFPRL